MVESTRTVTASTKVSSDVAEFLDAQAKEHGTTRSELLRKLVGTYRTSCETGVACPHCKNAVRIDL